MNLHARHTADAGCEKSQLETRNNEAAERLVRWEV